MFYSTTQNYIDTVVIPALGELYKIEFDLQTIALQATIWDDEKNALVEIVKYKEFWRVIEQNWLPSRVYVAEFIDAEPDEAKLAYEAGIYFIETMTNEEAEGYAESPFLVLSHPFDEELAFVYRTDMA